MRVRQFGRYQLEALIGAGGMGEVYRAYDTQRHRWVAVKLLPDALSNNHSYKRRFRRESYLAASLREPHVIPIHDFGELEGRLFIDMRLVDGESIHTILEKEGPIPPPRTTHIIGQVAEALEAAHVDGLVHRDIKPSNILVTATDFVYVVDFGIAQAMSTDSTVLTVSGTAVGTLDYMAPERFENRDIDSRSDVYSLTCLLHECLTASRPFSGDDLPSLMYAHIFSSPPQPSKINPGVPEAFDSVIARGMAKSPGARFCTALELAEAAKAALTGHDPATSALSGADKTADTPGSTPVSRSDRASELPQTPTESDVGAIPATSVADLSDSGPPPDLGPASGLGSPSTPSDDA
ncbi:MAG TPA: protein kinase, partial [Pseudonocardiaceae bacterium]